MLHFSYLPGNFSHNKVILFLDPEWASSNMGVFICVNCSGIHRMLGTHISRVKSCLLDQWSDDAVQVMFLPLKLLASTKIFTLLHLTPG